MSDTGYPAGTIAKLLMITTRRLQQLAKEGVVFETERGRYDLVKSVQGRIRHVKERFVGSASLPALAGSWTTNGWRTICGGLTG